MQFVQEDSFSDTRDLTHQKRLRLNGMIRKGMFKAVPGRPLGAILYLDEVTPGNVLRPDNRRKFWSIYLGFKEFAAAALCREQFWLPLAVLRTCVSHDVKGGISLAVRELIRSVLLAPCELSHIGVAVDMLGGPQLVRADLKHILADEAALKSVWSCKGAAGIRPCMLCRNVMALRSDLTEGQEYLVDVACSDPARFHLSTDEDIWEAWDNLASKHGRVTKAAFGNLEKASGFSYDPDALLSDRSLRRLVRPATATTMDWLHNFLQNGVASHEIAAFLTKCRSELQLGYQDFHNFVRARWVFPYGQATHKIDAVFSEGRERSGGVDAFRATASETLMVFPILRHFAETLVRPTHRLDPACESLMLLCRILDEYLRLKRRAAPATDLIALISAHLEKHKSVYGLEYVKPKHHFAFHNALRHHLPDEVFLDCFVLERKHQVSKGFGTAIKNTSSFERSVLSRALLEQSRQLQNAKMSDSLLGGVVSDATLSKAFGPEARFAKSLQHGGLVVGVNDVVFYGADAGVVMACVEVQDGVFVIVLRPLVRIGGGNAHTTWRQATTALRGLRLGGSVQMSLPYAWAWEGAGDVLTLHSAQA